MANQDAFVNCLHQNKTWSEQTSKTQPDLLPTLSKGQSPKILWLGCSDSRIPETTILGLKPGDVFVHRNIANILTPTDLSSQSVIAYAVHHLHVEHIVVCGHTSCGGVAAALANGKLGVLDTWLTPLRKLRAENSHQWKHLGEKERAIKLVEANVVQGVKTVRENAEVIEGAERGVKVHGVVYDLATGLLREVEVREGREEEEVRREAFSVR